MFIRFRETKTRLQLSVIETSRYDGKVRQHRVASLGSLPRQPLPSDRVAFWKHIDARLDQLRLDATLKAKLRGEIEARVPLPSARDQKRTLAQTSGEKAKRVREAQAAPQVALKDYVVLKDDLVNLSEEAAALKASIVNLSETNAALKARIAELGEIRYPRYTATLYDLLTAYAQSSTALVVGGRRWPTRVMLTWTISNRIRSAANSWISLTLSLA